MATRSIRWPPSSSRIASRPVAPGWGTGLGVAVGAAAVGAAMISGLE